MAGQRKGCLVSEEIRERKLSAHVKIGFNKRQLSHRDVYRWVLRWVCIRGLFIVENGHVFKVVEVRRSTPQSR